MSNFTPGHSAREITKRMQQLSGIVSGLLADGHLADQEILYLRTWLTENSDLCAQWPASAIRKKIVDVLEDGAITEEERDDLSEFLSSLSPDNFAETGSAQHEPAALPVNDCVTIDLKNAAVCLTGLFAFGPRAACERAVLAAGGMPCDNVTKKTDILVVGSMVSKAWLNTNYGRKILAAVALQEKGHSIEIISEPRWVEAVSTATA